MVQSVSGKPTAFSMAKLTISIYSKLPNTPHKADHAQALADSVYQTLSERTSPSLYTKDIADTTYTVLRRFNAQSGLSYAVAHNIITPDAIK